MKFPRVCSIVIFVTLITPAAMADAPVIETTLPQHNAIHAPPGTTVSVTFDSDMDSSTITSSSWLIIGGLTGHRAGTMQYDSLARTATFTPGRVFLPGEPVTAILTTAVLSLAGTPLARAYQWSFTIASGYVHEPAANPFSQSTTYPGGGSTLAAGDLDSDGDIDLVSGFSPSASTYDTVRISLNDGAGHFSLTGVYQIRSRCLSLVTADLDNDGDLDIAAGTSVSDIGRLFVLLNQGNAVFDPPVEYMHGSKHALAGMRPADMDGDGDIDLVAANGYYGGYVSVMTNNGTGGFALPVDYSVGFATAAVAVADLDLDGDVDVVVQPLAYTDHSVAILVNLGDGSLDVPVLVAFDYHPLTMVAADVDSDLDVDIAVATGTDGLTRLLLNDGSAAFPETTAVAGRISLVSDLDGEGTPDIMAAGGQYMGSRYSVCVIYTYSGAGVLTDPVFPFIGAMSSNLLVDVDGDGDLDFCGVLDDSLAISENWGIQRTTLFTKSATFVGGNLKNLVADLNNDGFDDIIAESTYIADGMGGLYSQDTIGVRSQANTRYGGYQLADVDNDADLDLVVSGPPDYSAQVALYFNDGDGHFLLDSVYDCAPGTITEGRTCDFNNDGLVDIIATNSELHQPAHLLWNLGAGRFVVTSFPHTGATKGVDIGDYDKDGDFDALWSANMANAIIYSNDGRGNLAVATSLPWGYCDNPPVSTFADLNADGFLDVILVNTEPMPHTSTNYINDGGGTFSQTGTPVLTLRDHLYAHRAPDVDNDGDFDVCTNYINGGNGLLEWVTDVWGLWQCFGHLDDDGYVDMAYGNGWVYMSTGEGLESGPPSAPAGLLAVATDTSIEIQWDAASDAITPEALLKYNVRVGLTPSGNEVFSGVTPRWWPNVEHNTRWVLYLDMTQQCEVFWSVQSQDGSLLRSGWAAEQRIMYDPDGDSVGYACDNCPEVANADQADLDEDGLGDVCDDCTDPDEDGVGNAGLPDSGCTVGGGDNCPAYPNPLQKDADTDGVGDSCDNCITVHNLLQEDSDSDSKGDSCDNCISDANPLQEDTDSDLFGDVCDNCPLVFNPDQADTDSNGIGDACDAADTMRIVIRSSLGRPPVYMIVTDPKGDSISPFFNTILAGSAYDSLSDYDGDSQPDEIVTIPNPMTGEYFIHLVPKEGASDTVEFTLSIGMGVGAGYIPDGYDSISIPDLGVTVPDAVGWIAETTLAGDCNADGAFDAADIVYLVNYVFKSGPPPVVATHGDVDCNGWTDAADIIRMVNFIFKSGTPPCSQSGG